jgi:hypothetical protein
MNYMCSHPFGGAMPERRDVGGPTPSVMSVEDLATVHSLNSNLYLNI